MTARDLGVHIALAALYFAAGKLGLSLAFIHPSATAVWPPTGIALAALILMGRRFWPGIFAGAFIVNATTAGNAATSLGIAAGNTLEALLGAAVIERFAGGREAFDSPRRFFNFVLAGTVCPVISATMGTGSLWLGGFVPHAEFLSVWTTWWLGDVSGALLIAPLIILWANEPTLSWRPLQWFEAALILAATGAVAWIVFWNPPFFSLAYLSVPILVWTAFRFGRRETAVVLCLLLGLALGATLNGRGPFAADTPHHSLLRLQLFMAIIALTKMSLAIIIWRNLQVENALRRAHEELEERVRQRTQSLREKSLALERSNQDLREFAAAASHDLQEPLHKIANFIELFRQKYSGRIDAEADQIIGYVVDGASRMERLIRDLLNYSRVGQAELAMAPVDMNEALDQAESSLEISIRQCGGRVTRDLLPKVLANETHMVQLFQNLVGNAIKFRAEQAPLVHVSARHRNGEWIFSVSDNGIGIEPKYAERIFGIFQRLHPRSRYGGTGIGLALCRKILERHGGKIWVESEPGKGSTFRFTLPFSGSSPAGSRALAPASPSPDAGR